VHQETKAPVLPIILLTIPLLAAVISVALTFWTESRWIGHAVTSIVGLFLMCVVILTGAAQKGRSRTIRIYHIFRYHRIASICFSLIVIVTFILGLLTMLEHGEPLLISLHGLVGLALITLAIVQLVPSLLVRERIRIRFAHMVVGYTIIPFYIVQMILGLSTARIVILNQ
jgi:hypothetical protein